MIEAMVHLDIVPYDLFIPSAFFLQRGLQCDLAFDLPSRRQSGGISRGVEGERSGGVRVEGGGEGRCGWPGSAAPGLGLLFWRWDMMTMRTVRCHYTIQIGDLFLHLMGAGLVERCGKRAD